MPRFLICHGSVVCLEPGAPSPLYKINTIYKKAITWWTKQALATMATTCLGAYLNF